MSEIAVTADTALVAPHTGELLNLNDAPAVARALTELRDHRQAVNDATSVLTDALVQHAQRAGKKTLHLHGVGKVELSGGPDSAVHWDLEILEQLRAAGLPEDRWNELVRTDISYSVNAAVAKQIESSGNERYREIVGMARQRADRPWRAQVKS